MDFGFSQEQEQLRSAVREFLAEQAPVALARQAIAAPAMRHGELWAQMAELGWLGLTISETCGGSGLGNLELALVMEEMGRVVFPAPYASSIALAAAAVARMGSAAQQAAILPGIANGEIRATVAVAEAEGSWSAARLGVRAESDGDDFRIGGEKLFVPDARGADLLMTACRIADGVGLFLVAPDAGGLSIEPMTTVDGTRPLDAVVFDDVLVTDGALLGGIFEAQALDGLIDVAKVALSAELCGLADAAIDMSVEYAKMREQFGRPIGSFQAIQHKLADMKVAVENAKSLVYYAAWALDGAEPDARRAAAMAKAYASECCPTVVADAIQVHGGVGFTWEHDLHLYLKRAKADEVTYGDATENRELVASLLPLEAP